MPQAGFDGSIPARAGEPKPDTGLRIPCPVYPRACGGTNTRAWSAVILSGLSPRVRGNLKAAPADAPHIGSIPARAGEPQGCPGGCAAYRVYPRACGGTHLAGCNPCNDTGLSPRVRGNQPRRPLPSDNRRSIPARAGEPRHRTAAAFPVRVYPRACGGTRCCGSWPTTSMGLSPRVRGNRAAADQRCNRGGSIPARAGEPLPYLSFLNRREVYPRACGGTSLDRKTAALESGLSPRVRGT